LQNEVGNWLKSLFLAHHKANLLCLFVAEKFTIASSALLPLFISEAVKLASDLEDALFFLFTGYLFNLGELSLFDRELKSEK